MLATPVNKNSHEQENLCFFGYLVAASETIRQTQKQITSLGKVPVHLPPVLIEKLADDE